MHGLVRKFSDSPPVAQWTLWLLLLVLVAWLFGWSDSRHGRVRRDFTRYSLDASRVLWRGGDPYSKEDVGKNHKYLPINTILLGPFTLLSDPAAQGCWMAINFLLIGLCYRAHGRWLSEAGTRIPWWVYLAAAAMAFRFTWSSLKLGQWNTSVYCLAFLGLAAGRRRPWTGGMLLGLAGVLKYMPAFFLLYYISARRWKHAAGLAVGLLTWSVIVPTLVLGPSRHLELFRSYREKARVAYSRMTADRTITGVSLRSTLYGYLVEARHSGEEANEAYNLLDLDPSTGRAIVVTLSVGLLIALCALTARGASRRANDPFGDLIEIGAWFCLLLCISPEVRTAHLLTLFTPSFALLAAIARGKLASTPRRFALAGIASAALFVLLDSRIMKGVGIHYYADLYGALTAAFVMLLTASISVLFWNSSQPQIERSIEPATRDVASAD